MPFASMLSIAGLHLNNQQEAEINKPVASLTNIPNVEFVPLPIVIRTIQYIVYCAIPYSTNFVKRNGKTCFIWMARGYAQCVMKLKQLGLLKILNMRRKTPMIYKRGPFGLESKKPLLLEDIGIKKRKRRLI